MKTRSLTFALFFLCSLIAAAQKQAPGKEAKFPPADAHAKAKLSHKIIDAPNKTYGYDIYSDNKLLIHQPSVPGVAGNEGFKTKAGAEKVARLVIGKIKKGEMPPTVTVEEMKGLKAIP